MSARRGGTVSTASSHLSGLTAADAAERLRRDGPNLLPSARPRTLVAIAADVLREPMLLLLVATSLLYVTVGSPVEAISMLVAVGVVLGISFVQERRTERTLHALRTLASPRALVLRDGVQTRIPGADVVRDDVVFLEEGDCVPADGQLADTAGITVDESMLTGESVAVVKGADDPVFSGTLVVGGRGTARITATGAATELGRIGQSLETVQTSRTPLQLEVRRVVRLLAALGLAACLLVVLIYGVGQGRWLTGMVAGLTLAISMVPEEFPVILTIFLALGAWRISERRVLTRRFPAIEALGAATVLCVDKTGTLTLNRMSIAGVDCDGQFVEIHGDVAGERGAAREAVVWGALASAERPVDPIDLALSQAASGALPKPAWLLEREYPLTSATLIAANAWVRPDGSAAIAAKGAPEAIATLCRFDQSQMATLRSRIDLMAARGLRVLGIARADLDAAPPDALTDVRFEYLGLVGFADPVRPAVPAAIDDCRSAGLRVVMLTGDYPATALAIARAATLDTSGGVLTGSEVEAATDDELQAAASRINVFARMVPVQKLRLVRALQACGEVVAMTGDGVNDAPALKAADIGVAMGMRGTDVAREAGALVLLDDDFASIVGAVRLGRRIYDNIRKATGYVLAIHLPIAGMSLLPPILGWPLVLLPLHVVFMELIVDPACSIAFEMEPEEGNVMARPPRRPGTRLFDRRLVSQSLLQGAGMLAVTFAVYAGAIWMSLTEDATRTVAFTTLIVANLALLLANRSRGGVADIWRLPNPAAWLVVGLALAALSIVLMLAPLRGIFRLAPPESSHLLVALLAGLVALAWMEGSKRLAPPPSA
ncbi:MAG: cation-translocating P-type ATPase [Vicinamibacterales bacterium]